MNIKIDTLRKETEQVLMQNILPFWIDKMQDLERSGFYGRMRADGTPEREAVKGAVLNARILWTFSAAYRIYGNQEYLRMAERAVEYLLENFVDKGYGGLYWSVNADGSPCDTKKQFYALGFAVYGLSEFYRATGDERALEFANVLYSASEAPSFAATDNGSVEDKPRDCAVLWVMRLLVHEAIHHILLLIY